MRAIKHGKLTVDVTDESGDTDLFIPAGTVVRLVEDTGIDWIVETLDKRVSLPVCKTDVEPLD